MVPAAARTPSAAPSARRRDRDGSRSVATQAHSARAPAGSASAREPPSASAKTAAAVYLGVSTEEQAQDGSGNGGSLLSQEERCRACAARGLEVTHVFADPGASGGTLDRPGLTALRAAVAVGEVAVVVVFAVDRLYRRQVDTSSCSRSSSATALASPPPLTTSPTGRAMLGMLAVFAELQRSEIRERTRHAPAAKKRRGEAVSRTPMACGAPAGATSRTPPPGRSVARVLSKRAAGASCEAIAAEFNADGVPTASGAGRWHPPSVSKLCRNRWIRAAAGL